MHDILIPLLHRNCYVGYVKVEPSSYGKKWLVYFGLNGQKAHLSTHSFRCFARREAKQIAKHLQSSFDNDLTLSL